MRSIAVLVVGALVAGAAACGGKPPEFSGSDASSMKVGLAYDIGGRGDQSFNDAAASGLDDAKRNLGLRTVKELEATPGETDAQKSERLRVLAEAGYSPIIAVGYAYSEPMKRVAPDFPATRFAIVDDTMARGPNISNLLFAEEQGSFLVGAAAALKSRTGHVGFVGGVQSPLVKKFEIGFTQGVKYIKPEDTVDVKYVAQPPDLTGFDDPAKGRLAAQGMYDAGADVVYQAAGGSGAGVFEAAYQQHAWAIGVDSDQAKTAAPEVRGNILTSMLKKVDVAVYDYIASILDGTVKSGPTVYDLRLGGVDYSTTGGHIRDIQPRLEELKQEIIVGKIKVRAA
ncbi:BMP family ABC transporter substrate-binding protein [Planotetraspora phitsanulokensis]|uniref:BMP family ABC transporter substrate-binding protein n=1 Tax=Planotetraspora phitsanulokensis TaxID=575192 RepID=A0A8J3XLA5_9ACTN|nr:BMP family ABC transporter substrate-binding protein [Planotetraspora phitsanulokensis]GII40473.1 BMP family ABC transporter substrate-binding protein [Planotetraspora phitsanulokensis]